MNAPVIIFAYNRPVHIANLLSSLAKCSNINESHIYVYCDGPKSDKDLQKVLEVRRVVFDFKSVNQNLDIEIIESETNKGLARSVIEAVSHSFNQYNEVIVLEDDLVVSENFIDYMNESLVFYKDDKDIWSISGYNSIHNIPKDYTDQVYLSRRASSWGWATWRDRWELVDWDIKDYSRFEYNLMDRKRFNRGGKDMSAMLDAQIDGRIDSWAIRWCYAQFRHGMYSVNPISSLVKNHGFDGTGTHGVRSQDESNFNQRTTISLSHVVLDERIQRLLCRKYGKHNKIPLLSFIRHLLAKGSL